MEEPVLSEEKSHNESLASVPPAPITEAPEAMGLKLTKGVLLLSAVSAGAIVLIANSEGRCMGATRSSKLQWEQRQLEMDRAEADEQSSEDSVK